MGKKSILLFTALLMVLTMAACTSDSGNDEVTPPESDDSEQVTQDDSSSEESQESDSSGFTPGVAVPDGLPVYPGAELANDLPGGEGRHQWLYQTTGSGNDIVEFFVDAFQDLGFGIDSDFTFAEREEFVVTTSDHVVQVYWLGSEESDLTADTPNRGYGIVVLVDQWEAR